MLMWLRMAPALHLIFLLIIHRVSAAEWSTKYNATEICALQNSTMTISCTFTHPEGLQIMRAFWNKNEVKHDGELTDLSEDPEYSQRLQYLGDKQHNRTVRLSHVTKKDEHEYYFRITTNVSAQKWLGKPGVRLSVTDLQLESPERVTEGDSVRLTCKSSCKLTDTPTFIWYRNSHTLTNIGDELNIRSVSRTEAGHYSCGVQGQMYISPAVYLDVTCKFLSVLPFSVYLFKTYRLTINMKAVELKNAPDTPVIFLSGSAIIKEGDSVTLMCISHSNPPALNFSWFEENQSSAVGSGQSFSAVQSGRFYCEAHNPHGAQRSDAVTVTGEAFIITLL
nr:B-cell receptor CD22-like [Danio rerio]|eukprot:XP_021333810.1 B-cell receptor CD22-like [Danio rerio]